jgi:hypothetical protein
VDRLLKITGGTVSILDEQPVQNSQFKTVNAKEKAPLAIWRS